MLIAVTQRVEVVASYGETRDCLDQGWARLLSSIGCSLLPIPNIGDAVTDWISQFEINGLILSGGNDLTTMLNGKNPSQIRDTTEQRLLEYSEKIGTPVVGVCRGMQFISTYFGGTLRPVSSHVAKRHSLCEIPRGWAHLIPTNVNSYHDWGILREDLPKCFQPIALSNDSSVEAISHSSLPWLGVMWHPERELSWAVSDQAMLLHQFREGSLTRN